MKKATLFLLALTAATPALAQDAHDDRDHGHHDNGGKHDQARPAGHGDAHAARPDHGPAGGQGDRGARNDRQPSRPSGPQFDANRGGDPRRGAVVAPAASRDRNDRAGQWNGRNDGRASNGQPGWDHRNDGVRPDDHRSQSWQTGRAPGWHPDDRNGGRNGGYRGNGYRGDDRRGDDDRGDRGDGRGWNQGWRSDPRYNWQGYRRYNAQRFHAPRYFAPRGYGYRQWSPGLRVEPFFYDRNYWIQDFYDYRLPPPPPGAQWVRYYNDIALINVYDGTVLDVIQGFFY